MKCRGKLYEITFLGDGNLRYCLEVRTIVYRSGLLDLRERRRVEGRLKYSCVEYLDRRLYIS
jgi:hypothetical protein